MKKVIIVLLLISLYNLLNAKVKIIEESASHKPDWIKEAPKGFRYDYFSGFGVSSTSYKEAKNIAINDAIKRIGEKKGVEVTAITDYKQIEKDYQYEDFFSEEIQTKVLPTELFGLEEEESYYRKLEENKNIKYEFYILVRIPKGKIEIGKKPPTKFSYVWRSALIPGWGQFYKKQTKKGYIFLGSETILITTALLSNYLSVHYNDKAKSASDISVRKDYMDWSDTAEAFAITTGIAAGVLYIYNIFDATLSRGPKQYALIDNQVKFFINIDKNKNVNFNFAFNW